MVDMVAPNGAVVSVRDDAVRQMLDAGFVMKAEPAERPKAAPKRRSTKRTAKK